jgi:hypothetical protein
MFGDFDPLHELELCKLELTQQIQVINTLIKEFNTHSEIILNLAKTNEQLSKLSARDTKRIMALEKRVKQLEDDTKQPAA